VLASSILSIEAGDFIIVGDNECIYRGTGYVENEERKQDFVDEIKDVVQPWFDYTPSKGLGVRVPPEPKVTTDPSSVDIPSSKVSGTLAGQSFSCDKAALEISTRSLTLSGANADNEVVVSLKLNWSIDPSGRVLVPVNQKIPVQTVELRWRRGDKPKTSLLRQNSVASVEFGGLNGNRMMGKLYIESSRRQQTKLLGTFEAEIR
jgi:hypothetical protein